MILITGATGGIGLETAKQRARDAVQNFAPAAVLHTAHPGVPRHLACATGGGQRLAQRLWEWAENTLRPWLLA